MNTVSVTFLGSGTILSGRDVACTSVLLRSSLSNILVDCGPGALFRLKQINLTPSDLQYIFITHFHPDHFADLIPVLFHIYNTHGESPDPDIISIWGPPGIKTLMRNLGKACGEWLESPAFSIHDLPSVNVILPHFSVEWRQVRHSPESVGYRFIIEDRVIAFSGDSGPCPELHELCHQADVAILECSYPDFAAVSTHLTPRSAAMIARAAGVNHLIVNHLYPETLKENPVAIIKNYFTGRVDLAGDLQTFLVERPAQQKNDSIGV